MKKLIEFKDVTITLRGSILFKNINFIINEGDRYVLTGKNGAGKSLLLELLALGYTRDLKSRYKGIEITGEIIDENGKDLLNPNTDRNVSYVSQYEEFYNNSTILDEAIASCNGSKIEFDEAELDILLKTFDLQHKKKQKIKNNVSFGEGKIIHLITRILKLKNSNILLLDEPINHLSFQNSKLFNDIILKEIKNNPNLTIIMISHCRALSFVDKSMFYDYNSNEMKKADYKVYDCFEKVQNFSK